MAYREVVDSSSGSGSPMNDGEAKAPSDSPTRASYYEDKPPSGKAFDIEATTMQQKRENNGGQEIPGIIMNNITRTRVPSPKIVPGYLAVGGPAFPRTSTNVTSKTASLDIEEDSGFWHFLGMKTDRKEHIAQSIRSNWQELAWAEEAMLLVRQAAMGAAQSALGAEASRWVMPETHGGVSVEFKENVISSSALHGENFGLQHNDSDRRSRDAWGFSCQGDMYRRVPKGENFDKQQNDTVQRSCNYWGVYCQGDGYGRAPSRPQAADPRGAQREAGGAALFDPWASLNQDAMVSRAPRAATPPQAPAPHSTPRDTTGRAPSDLWAPLNLDIECSSVEPIVTQPPGTDDAQPRAVGPRPLPTDAPEARAVEPEIVPAPAAPKKPLILLTPEDFLTLSNTDISSMLGGTKGTKSGTESVESDGTSDGTEDEPSGDSDEGSLTDSDQRKEDTESDDGGGDKDGGYIHPMQVISDSIDKVDSWLQKHSDVLASGVAAAGLVVEAPLFEMPADDEVVERCQDIKRRESESTLDLARRKLRANCIKFERVAARFEKLYNEHLLEKTIGT